MQSTSQKFVVFLCRLSLLLVVIVTSGCAAKLKDLPGRYVCQYPFGVELLILRKDGTFTQLVDVDGTDESVVHRGAWEYNEVSGELRLLDAILVDNNFGELNRDFMHPKAGAWVLEVTKHFGTTSLHWNPDFNYEFHQL